jgi:hypothetical protein
MIWGLVYSNHDHIPPPVRGNLLFVGDAGCSQQQQLAAITAAGIQSTHIVQATTATSH